MDDRFDKWISWAVELQALSQAGLFYGHDKYDMERYQRMREISAEMMAAKSDLPLDRVTDLFCADSGYQTPKIDTRAAIFKDDRVLLVHETGGGWVLPGGWCEIGLSPAENAVKEAKEESGLDVTVKKLIAVHDRAKHNRPKEIHPSVKMFFLCEAVGGEFTPNIETCESGWFEENALPDMDERKCSAEQVRLCFKAHRAAVWEAEFD